MTMQELRDRYNAAVAARDAALEAIEQADADISADDLDALQGVFDDAQAGVERARAAVDRREAAERARAEFQPVSDARQPTTVTVESRVSVGHEPRTYGESHAEATSRRVDFFRDLALAQTGNIEARQRLERHVVEHRDVDRTDSTSMGDFVPPVWVMEEAAMIARAGRVCADLCRSMPLPSGTDSVRIPRVTTGSSVAIQTADNAALSETDMVGTSVTAPVVTIGGIQDVALQLVEQSPMNITDLVLADLAADYARKLDAQVINGSGASGQALGILGTSSITATTYTDATPTAAELYPYLSDNVRDTYNARFVSDMAFVWNPKLWFFLVKALDGSSRPFITFNANGPYNAYGSGNMATPPQGEGPFPVGNVLGIPVYLDANVPTNLGAGTNETRSILMNRQDNILMESAPRVSTHPDTGSGTMTMRYRFYRYVAFTAGRYPAGNGVVSGTGLIV